MVQVVQVRVLLRCLNLLEEPTAGHIYIDGLPIMELGKDINKLRQGLEWYFNSSIYFHMTVIDNVTLAPIKLKRCLLEWLRERYCIT